MNTRRAKVIFCSAMLALAGSVFSLVRSADNSARTDQNQGRPIDVSDLDNDKLWTKVNNQPYPISSYVDALCRAPTQTDYALARERNPHSAAFVNVYVNKIGLGAMSSTEQPLFPVGSVLVKEKFYPHGDVANEKKEPDLFTVMLKREAGYNPESGDWEFAVVSGDGKQTQARGKLANCMSCHVSRRASDYVYRSYLPKQER
jgi:hypothetical protein